MLEVARLRQRSNTRRGVIAFVVAIGIVCALPAAVIAKPGEIKLTPQQETTSVDSDGSGSFSYTIDGDQLCYTLAVSDLTGSPVGAHIHPGARNVAGGIAVHLLTPPAATSTVSECITAVEGGNLTPAELAAIAEDPKSFYVNVHTERYRAGEIRGQLK